MLEFVVASHGVSLSVYHRPRPRLGAAVNRVERSICQIRKILTHLDKSMNYFSTLSWGEVSCMRFHELIMAGYSWPPTSKSATSNESQTIILLTSYNIAWLVWLCQDLWGAACRRIVLWSSAVFRAFCRNHACTTHTHTLDTHTHTHTHTH